MDLGIVLWKEPHTPNSAELHDRMVDDGFDVVDWTDPEGTTYDEHSHGHDEVIVTYSGKMEFTVEGKKYLLDPGDTLFLPKGTVHSARVVGGHTSYLIGRPKIT